MTKRTRQRKSSKYTPGAPLHEAVRQVTYDYMTTHHNSVPSTDTPAIKTLMRKEYDRQLKKSTGLFKTQPSWKRIEGWTNRAIDDGVQWHDRDEEKDQRDAAILRRRQQQEQQYHQHQQALSKKAHHQRTTKVTTGGGSFGLGGLLELMIFFLILIFVLPTIITFLSTFFGNLLHPILYKNGMSLLTAFRHGLHYSMILAAIVLVILLLVDLGFLISQKEFGLSINNFLKVFPFLYPLPIIIAAFLITFFIYTFFHVSWLFKILLVPLAYYAYNAYTSLLIHE